MKLFQGEYMIIIVTSYGNIIWKFYRKSYKKARWRKSGQRVLNNFLKDYPAKGIICVK